MYELSATNDSGELWSGAVSEERWDRAADESRKAGYSWLKQSDLL